MKKKISLTLLLALFVIAGSWAQKNQAAWYGSNDRQADCCTHACHSNGKGHSKHGGKHTKHKKHKHKHHGHDHDYGHHDHDYGYHNQGDQCRKDDGRDRDRDRDDNWSNSGSRPVPSTRPVRNSDPAPRSVRAPLPRHRTITKPASTPKAVKVSNRSTTSRPQGSPVPARRTARPGN